jgi:hypothetical protein
VRGITTASTVEEWRRAQVLRYAGGMTRALMVGIVLLTAACGQKAFGSLCDNQVPPPPECNTACDPSPGALNTCPAGYHCAADGQCDAQCTPTGGQCGNGYSCTTDGFCQSGGGSDVPPIDASCPSVRFTATKTIPTVELLLDQSGSMNVAYGNTDRWNAMRSALIDPANGVVSKLADQVVFGATLYSGVSAEVGGREVGVAPCPRLINRPRVINNAAAIRTMLMAAAPIEDTPTADSIDAVKASFAANPAAAGSPPIIVLATDGLPDTCADADPPAGRQAAANATSVAAAQRAYAAGIKLFFLFVGDDAAGDHPKQMANAGAGKDPLTGNEVPFVANNPAELAGAFNTIIGGVVSCDLKLSGRVNDSDGPRGTVTLNGNPLTYGTDWTLDADGITIRLIGDACTTLKSSANPVVDAVFACGAVIF